MSGIAQGLVLWPLIVVIFINDLPEFADSVIYLFANDTNTFNSIRSRSDSDALQGDLEKMLQWVMTDNIASQIPPREMHTYEHSSE
ncbi:endonuclease-reverse transcriptase [Plakobranchus ocellatus]|uniref:Endonuclease-reverse transcriptase n=1 Tax=Plakobranchus ocellatus TaxID=259542 RepID=A0AAV3XUI8_9GAST|nr:endonuclease-reverse transcriptase [Plakobranchus ocellatus]